MRPSARMFPRSSGLPTCLLVIAIATLVLGKALAQGDSAADDVLAIGFVGPLPLQSAVTFDPYREPAEAALRGLLMAADDAGILGMREVKVYVANAPTAEAAARAALRMIAIDGVDVIVGGFATEQALALKDAVRDTGVTAVNVGSSDPRLRLCGEDMLHLEVALDEYVWAALTAAQAGRIALVYDQDLAEAISEIEVKAQEVLEGVRLLTLPVAGDTLVWTRTLRYLAESSVDGVVLALPRLATENFIEQADGRLTVPVFVVPTLDMQTWSSFAAHAIAPELEVIRIVLWSPSVSELAEDIGNRYASRWGVAMDSAGWVGYQAVFAALGLGLDVEGHADLAVLEAMGGRFSPADVLTNGQVNQTLYGLVLDNTASWSQSPYDQMALAADVRVIGRPDASSAWLSRYACE